MVRRRDPWRLFMDKLTGDLEALIISVTIDGEIMLRMDDAMQIFGLWEKQGIGAMLELRVVINAVALRVKDDDYLALPPLKA